MPIIPVVAAGVDETFLGLNDGRALSKRLFGRNDVPAWLALGVGGLWPLALPLPVRIRQHVGSPVDPTSFANDEAVGFLADRLAKLGVEDQLFKAGAVAGSTVVIGRDNGVVYWGDFGPVKASAGAFDGNSLTGKNTLLAAGRVQVDFWDPEPGYYLNGTFYGEKNILAIAAAGQAQDDNKAYSGDFLLEKKVPGGGAFSVEAEVAKYDRLGGYNSRYGTDQGGYALASYLFPPAAGVTGRFEILGKFAKALFRNGLTTADRDYDQKTSELNLNYVIRDFRARVMLFYLQKDFSAVKPNDKQVGVGFQVQM